MSVIASQDVHVDTAKGRLYARRWDPAGAAGAPIVLFHDSLGCVALWRDFPEQLASETGRSVVPTTGWASACRTPIPPRWSGVHRRGSGR